MCYPFRNQTDPHCTQSVFNSHLQHPSSTPPRHPFNPSTHNSLPLCSFSLFHPSISYLQWIPQIRLTLTYAATIKTTCCVPTHSLLPLISWSMNVFPAFSAVEKPTGLSWVTTPCHISTEVMATASAIVIFKLVTSISLNMFAALMPQDNWNMWNVC